jgi:hypothetical protein
MEVNGYFHVRFGVVGCLVGWCFGGFGVRFVVGCLVDVRGSFVGSFGVVGCLLVVRGSFVGSFGGVLLVRGFGGVFLVGLVVDVRGGCFVWCHVRSGRFGGGGSVVDV